MQFLRQIVEHQAPLIGHYACGVASFSSHLKRWLHHALCCVPAIHIDASTHLGAPMFMLLSALLWLEKAWFVSPLSLNSPDSFLLLISQLQSVFCLSRFLCHHDQNLETQIISVGRWKLPRWHALREPLSPSPLMTPWPGRNSRSGVRASLNPFCSFSLCSVWLFGLRGLPPHSSSAFNISCKGRCWACASSWSCWSPVDFIQTVLTHSSHKLNRHVPIEEGCLKAAPTGGH